MNTDDDFEVGPSTNYFGSLKAGAYAARIAGIVNLGTQTYVVNRKRVTQRQYYVLFELLPNTANSIADMAPILFPVKVSATMEGNSKLRSIARAAMNNVPGGGMGFKVATLLGRELMITVGRNEAGFNDITGMRARSGIGTWTGFKVEPFLMNPIREVQDSNWQRVYEELSTNPNLPPVYGASVAHIVAGSDELNCITGNTRNQQEPDDGDIGIDDIPW